MDMCIDTARGEDLTLSRDRLGTRTYDDIGERAALQRRLLEASWPRVRAGGRLVYAVCSLEPEEGEALVAAFVRERGLRVAEEATWTPEEHGCDGFYLARIEGGS